MASVAEILGVDPTSTAVPRQFDPANRDLWAKALKSPVDKRVSEYLRLCTGLGRNPFRHLRNATDNQAITFELRRVRRFLVKYLDEWSVLKKPLAERLPPVTMKVKRTTNGFQLHGMLLLRSIDMVAIQQDLEKRLFIRYDGPYKVGKSDWHRKMPGYPLEIGFSAANDFEGYVWYTIHITTPPYVNELLDTDPDKAFAEFVVRRLWIPVVWEQKLRTTRAKF